MQAYDVRYMQAYAIHNGFVKVVRELKEIRRPKEIRRKIQGITCEIWTSPEVWEVYKSRMRIIASAMGRAVGSLEQVTWRRR